MASYKLVFKKKKILKRVDEGLYRGLTKAALRVQNDAANLAPVDTSALANSINYKVYRNTATVGSSMDYAAYVEYGTGIYAENGNGRKSPWYYENRKGELIRTLGQRPQPYLRPALDRNKNYIKNVIAKELKGGLK